ncbi:hypothetical protein HDC94_002223 [Leifsonia sp. AK011]|uniref:copper resistance CopC family protein n=1 Tax=Leifsonia sp. AK011 TaxID=2723075 RepID=UPI0015C88CDB|nr:copper resistance CopC family protein [Leifsonia sp. AK011]NYF11067.1 hypothetical protein [Leifsonia sp. AK011]
MAALALAGLSLGAAAPAAAHSYIVASSPAEGSTISDVPENFSVTANELLLDLNGDGSGFAIQVVDAAGLYYGDGCTVVSGSTLSMGATLGNAGDYRVYWQVISADGHVVSGEFPFVWAPGDGAVNTPGLGAPPVCGESATEPTPTPSATPEPDEAVAPEPSATATPVAEIDGESVASVNPFYIAGGIIGLLAVIVVIVTVARRQSMAGTDNATPPSSDGEPPADDPGSTTENT